MRCLFWAFMWYINIIYLFNTYTYLVVGKPIEYYAYFITFPIPIDNALNNIIWGGAVHSDDSQMNA